MPVDVRLPHSIPSARLPVLCGRNLATYSRVTSICFLEGFWLFLEYGAFVAIVDALEAAHWVEDLVLVLAHFGVVRKHDGGVIGKLFGNLC